MKKLEKRIIICQYRNKYEKKENKKDSSLK